MSHRRPQRRRIFLGCEGESEQSYGVLLHKLVAVAGHLHIDSVLLQPGGGDPLALVERAAKVIRHRESEFGAPYAMRAILLDTDKLGISPERDQKIQGIATIKKMHLVWQRPSHEALLLRHQDGYQTVQPPTAAEALARLCAFWPDYRKGAPTSYLLTRLSLDHIRRACTAEPELKTLLDRIGYFP